MRTFAAITTALAAALGMPRTDEAGEVVFEERAIVKL
jgi:hypothetical protein